MKLYFFFIILIFIVNTNGCTNLTDSSSVGINQSGSVNKITGQIESWVNGTSKYIVLTYPNSMNYLTMCSYSTIDAGGGFSLNNIGAPPASSPTRYFYPDVDPFGEVSENTYYCSDTTAKVLFGSLLLGNDTIPRWIGAVWYTNQSNPLKDAANGDYRVSYCYVNKDVKISGVVRTKNYYPNQNTEAEDYVHYNLVFLKGWNKQVYSIIKIENYSDSLRKYIKREYSYSNTEPSPGRWFVYKY